MESRFHDMERFRTIQLFPLETQVQNESETSFYQVSKQNEYQVFGCRGICTLFVQYKQELDLDMDR